MDYSVCKSETSDNFGGNLPHGILTKSEKRFIGVYGKVYFLDFGKRGFIIDQ
jgi:hypothetical protein